MFIIICIDRLARQVPLGNPNPFNIKIGDYLKIRLDPYSSNEENIVHIFRTYWLFLYILKYLSPQKSFNRMVAAPLETLHTELQHVWCRTHVKIKHLIHTRSFNLFFNISKNCFKMWFFSFARASLFISLSSLSAFLCSWIFVTTSVNETDNLPFLSSSACW